MSLKPQRRKRVKFTGPAGVYEKPEVVVQPEDANSWLTVFECADFLRVSPVSIRRYLGQRILKKYKVMGRTLIKRSDAVALIKQA